MRDDEAFAKAPSAIVITDINNVLCLSKPYGREDALAALRGSQGRAADVFDRLFTAEAKAVLANVHQRIAGQVAYVISSTWRRSMSRSQLATVLSRSGLDFVAQNLLAGSAWCTPEPADGAERLQEVEAWIAQHHSGQSLVVLDDTHSGSSFLTDTPQGAMDLRTVAVLCQRGIGLQPFHEEAILTILARQGVRLA